MNIFAKGKKRKKERNKKY